jgi:hypothetical protein
MCHKALPREARIAAMHWSLSEALSRRRPVTNGPAHRAVSRVEENYGVLLPQRTDTLPTLPMGVSAPPARSIH